MRFLAANLWQSAAIELAPRHLHRCIDSPLPGYAIVVRRWRAHDRVQSCLEHRPALGVEPAVQIEDTVEGLTQIKEAPRMRLVGAAKYFIRLEAMTKVGSDLHQALGIELFGGADQHFL